MHIDRYLTTVARLITMAGNPSSAQRRPASWSASPPASILPALTSGLGVFLLRQSFLQLPSGLVDSGKIDGAGFFRIYWQVMLPLVGPALSALAILTFLGQWNNFFGPLLFLRSWQKMTLPIALVNLQGYMGSGSRSEVLAAIMLSIVPVLTFFLIGQRYVVQGIALTGLKG